MPKMNASAAHWPDSSSVTPIQSHVPPADPEQEARQEIEFRDALDTLLDIISDNEVDTSERTSRLLGIGFKYLQMSSGIVASAMGNSLEVICAAGDLYKELNPKDKLPIETSMCRQVLDNDTVLAVHNIAESEYASYCKEPYDKLQAYIGTQVVTKNGPLGVLSFCSYEPRQSVFSHQDKKLVSLIANWVGAVLGNEEQLEFLSLQNDYYQSLFQTVPANFMLCNPDGLILSTSNRLSDRLGLDPLSIPGQNCQRFFVSENAETLNEALAKGNVDHLPLTMQYENGDTLEVELNSSIKHIGSMQGLRMIVLADVSERNQAIRAAEEQNRQLALVNQSLNQFAFIASHDLQEPLRKIQQFSQFLAEDLGDAMSEEGQYYLNVIENSATRMSALIQDLLKFSSAAKGKLELSDIDMNQLLIDVQAELDLRIQETGAQVLVGELPQVAGDHSLVRQVFTNLIGNSIKYRDENRAPVIEVNTLIENDQLAITITDNGIGFDQTDASRAFEPFSRLHKDKRYTGNGIGLSICATVCEKHNWDLSAKSQPGKGSVFTIILNQSQ